MMNGDGRVDMIKSKRTIHNNSESISREFSKSSATTPQLTVSEDSKEAIISREIDDMEHKITTCQ